jgi:hypothetical protein
VFVEADPALRGRRVGAGGQAGGVPVGQLVLAGPALAGDAETCQQEGTGEALETVDRVAVSTLGAGELDAGVPG